MSIKQTIRMGIVAGIIAVNLLFTGVGVVSAEECSNGGDPDRGCSQTAGSGSGSSPQTVNTKTNNGCEVDTAIISCENVDTSKDGVENTGLWSLLLTAINILTAGVGVLALGGIVYGAVLYSAAGGNPEQVKKARTVFTNVVVGIVAFAAMYALLNFIVPGGVFN